MLAASELHRQRWRQPWCRPGRLRVKPEALRRRRVRPLDLERPIAHRCGRAIREASSPLQGAGVVVQLHASFAGQVLQIQRRRRSVGVQHLAQGLLALLERLRAHVHAIRHEQIEGHGYHQVGAGTPAAQGAAGVQTIEVRASDLIQNADLGIEDVTSAWQVLAETSDQFRIPSGRVGAAARLQANGAAIDLDQQAITIMGSATYAGSENARFRSTSSMGSSIWSRGATGASWVAIVGAIRRDLGCMSQGAAANRSWLGLR